MKIFKGSKEDNLQYEFLPPALEITETPPSPLGRALVWIIFAIFFAAIVWACIGRVDVVAVARGKIIPDGRLKVVQPLEEGIITAIHVDEGQRVKKGQLLIELDSTLQSVDVESLEESIMTAEIERDLLKKVLDGEDIAELTAKQGLSEEIKRDLLAFTRSKDSEYRVKQQSLKLAISQKQAELKIEQSKTQKLEYNLSMLKEKEQLIKTLYEAGAVEKQKYRDVCDEIVLAQDELQIQNNTVLQSAVMVEEAKADLENFIRERNTSLLNAIVDNDKKITELEAELTKSQKSVQFQSLCSPVDGFVHGLVSNTIGGVVTPAEAIMTIVPDGTPLVAEAMLSNKDIGFVTVGQKVALKLDTFPFQKYGTISGKVLSISPDAFEDEKLGSVYKMKISLNKTSMNIAGKKVGISPGMTVTAEIKTGKRRIIEFFLEPIIKYTDESLKIR
ncbi:MAG: HlyD family type I secretion periplasmic adaptor subunit [Syntrophomonas sp.]